MTQSLEQALALYIPEADLEAPPAPKAALATLSRLTRPQIELIKETVARGATDLQLALFVEECNTLGLNPFADEIYFIKYKSRQGGETVAMPIGIAGRRKFVYANPLYRGQVGPFWCGPDGRWQDVWLSDEPPAAAKVGIVLEGNPEPTWGVVTWREFNKVGQPGDKFWRNSPAHMLAIRAESHATRKVAEQAPAPASPVITAEYLANKADQIQRDQALPARTAPPTDEEIRRQIFEPPDDEPEPEPEPEPEQPIARVRFGTTVRIRTSPSRLSVALAENMTAGRTVDVYEYAYEDSHVWARHAQGWSAVAVVGLVYGREV